MDELLASFRAVGLAELEQRAALLRRVDNKYAVDEERFAELARMLRDDHDVLEIDDRRQFSYRTIYFDTADLRCFRDHLDDRIPRFKARTRLYADTDQCVFEVKLKRDDDETDKRQIDYQAQYADRLTASAMRCLREALADADLDIPDELDATLRTSFRRVTLAARRGSERLTCDSSVRLDAGDRDAELEPGLVLVETKSESGDSPADRALARFGIRPISLSKYRVGIGLLGPRAVAGPQPGSDLFG